MLHTFQLTLAFGLYANATQPVCTRQFMAHAAVFAVSFCSVEPESKAITNKMEFKLLPCWIRDVFWLGPPAASNVPGPKDMSNPDVAPF